MKYFNNYKKKIAIAMIVIGLALIPLGIYLISNNKDNNNRKNEEVSNNNKKPDEEKGHEKVEELDINSDEVKKLYEIAKMKDKMTSNINSYPFSFYLEKVIYAEKEMKVKELDDKGFFIYSLLNFIKSKRYNFEYTESEKNNRYFEQIEIKKSELKKILYILFGDNYTIDDFDLFEKRIVPEVLNYNKDKDTYTIIRNGLPIIYSTIETKLIRVEKYKDYIYLYEKVGIITKSKTKYFSNAINMKTNFSFEKDFLENNEDKAKDLNGKSIWEYEDNLSTYRYVLKKDKNEEYHLESMGYVEIK